MMMDTLEEVMGTSKDDTQSVIKGKRTKRQRPPSPLALTMASSSSSFDEGGSGGGGGVDRATASSTTSAEFTESTEEEEDMANCLILLAQGHKRKVSEPATNSKVNELYVYQCKTCNRCFPSFQALGGHRASHKKLKANIDEKKVLLLMEKGDDQFNNTSTALSLQISNRATCSTNKCKFHECSVCGAEFTSGQALGGHMRRHRTFTSTAGTASTTMSLGTRSPESQEANKPRNVVQLDLDLNLPAPEDDHRESKFSFKSKEQVIVFSASSLVDCHY